MPPTCRRRPSELDGNVVWDPHERFLRGFEWRPHSAPPTECGQREKPSGKRSWGGPKRRLSTCAHSNSLLTIGLTRNFYWVKTLQIRTPYIYEPRVSLWYCPVEELSRTIT